jgi:hypothetical protein
MDQVHQWYSEKAQMVPTLCVPRVLYSIFVTFVLNPDYFKHWSSCLSFWFLVGAQIKPIGLKPIEIKPIASKAIGLKPFGY